MGFAAKEHHDPVEKAVIRVQEGEHEIAHHDPRQEVGKEHQRLIRLRLALGIQLVDHDGQRHRNDDAQNDEHDVVKKRVAQKHHKGVVVDEEAEVLKADKLAVQQIIKEALLRENLVLNERDHQPEHGQIAEQNIPDERRQTQQAQLRILARPLPAAVLSGRGRWLRRRCPLLHGKTLQFTNGR